MSEGVLDTVFAKPEVLFPQDKVVLVDVGKYHISHKYCLIYCLSVCQMSTDSALLQITRAIEESYSLYPHIGGAFQASSYWRLEKNQKKQSLTPNLTNSWFWFLFIQIKSKSISTSFCSCKQAVFLFFVCIFTKTITTNISGCSFKNGVLSPTA